ncbi:Tn7 transposase TnsA N-terminal domain-containing protein [Castellaniella denitrificans]|uniref:Tn7 transposase TnsA N-terminal domain-containing protein n=1 Tax=Castellaniella denitrificans TaxID=56119 RepID=UPI00360AEA6D
MKSARPVVTRAPHRRVGYIPCPWLQDHPVAYESLLECRFVYIALLYPSLREIFHQPFHVELGELGKYTPDYLLRCASHDDIVVEVKPRKFVSKHADKLQAAKVAIEGRGLRFLVCTEHEIAANGRDERASVILRHARSHLSRDLVESLLVRLRGLSFPMSVSALAECLGTTRDRIHYLIGRRELHLAPSLSDTRVFNSTDKKGDHDGDFSARAWFGGADW